MFVNKNNRLPALHNTVRPVKLQGVKTTFQKYEVYLMLLYSKINWLSEMRLCTLHFTCTISCELSYLKS